jgi:hypothetical protein
VTSCMVIGPAEHIRKVEAQNDIVENLMRHINKKNSTILPALIYLGPLRSQPLPEMSSSGSPEEAYNILNDCSRQFDRTPHSLETIERFLGQEPHPVQHLYSTFNLKVKAAILQLP